MLWPEAKSPANADGGELASVDESVDPRPRDRKNVCGLGQCEEVLRANQRGAIRCKMFHTDHCAARISDAKQK
jgi:hypothetical protein